MATRNERSTQNACFHGSDVDNCLVTQLPTVSTAGRKYFFGLTRITTVQNCVHQRKTVNVLGTARFTDMVSLRGLI